MTDAREKLAEEFERLVRRLRLGVTWANASTPPNEIFQLSDLVVNGADAILSALRAPSRVNALQESLNRCQQIAGRALGYPRYCDDQKNFPGTTDADGVCIGEHADETIVQELSNAYRNARENALREAAEVCRQLANYAADALRRSAYESAERAILALIPAKAAETAVDCGPIIAGQDYRGTEFNDAAMTVEKIIADWPGLGGQELYLRFRMVFGDPQTNPPPSAIADAVRAERERVEKIIEAQLRLYEAESQLDERSAAKTHYASCALGVMTLANTIRARATASKTEEKQG